jgi:hypothetical protein
MNDHISVGGRASKWISCELLSAVPPPPRLLMNSICDTVPVCPAAYNLTPFPRAQTATPERAQGFPRCALRTVLGEFTALDKTGVWFVMITPWPGKNGRSGRNCCCSVSWLPDPAVCARAWFTLPIAPGNWSHFGPHPCRYHSRPPLNSSVVVGQVHLKRPQAQQGPALATHV